MSLQTFTSTWLCNLIWEMPFSLNGNTTVFLYWLCRLNPLEQCGWLQQDPMREAEGLSSRAPIKRGLTTQPGWLPEFAGFSSAFSERESHPRCLLGPIWLAVTLRVHYMAGMWFQQPMGLPLKHALRLQAAVLYLCVYICQKKPRLSSALWAPQLV